MNRLQYVSVASALVTCIYGQAHAQVIEGWQHPPNEELGVGRSQIVVVGNEKRYKRVKNKKINAWVVVKGHAPNRAENPSGGTITIENTELAIESPSERKVYKLTFDYVGPRSSTVANARVNPVKLCNDRRKAKSGQERVRFLREGERFWFNQAYEIDLESTWLVRQRSRGVFDKPSRYETWEGQAPMQVAIVCRPLDKNAGATRTNPPPKPTRTNPPPSPTRTNLKPPRMTVKVSAGAGNPQRVGSWMCPRDLRINGRFDVGGAFRGTGLLRAQRWVSERFDLQFNKTGGRNIVRTYPLVWNIGGLSGGSNAALRQDLRIGMSVYDASGDMIESEVRTIRVTCRSPDPGAQESAVQDISG